MFPYMEITLSLADGIPVMSLAGRLDVTTSPVLEERIQPLLSTPVSKLILDSSSLVYVSSAGLRVFISAQRQLLAAGGGLAFSSLAKPVRDLFHLAGLEELFLIEDSVEAAVGKLSS